MTTPEYPLSVDAARMALMVYPDGTILERECGKVQYCRAANTVLIRYKPFSDDDWHRSPALPYSGLYRIIPIPEPPHVNPTLKEILKSPKVRIDWPEEWADEMYSNPQFVERAAGWPGVRVAEIDFALRVGAKVTILEGRE